MEKNKATRKTALVTGGSRGIGKGIVTALAQKGYDVCFSYVTSRDEAEQIKADITLKYGVKCECFHASLNEKNAPINLVNKAVDFLGHISVLVNNAGITIFKSILEMTPDEMDSLIDLDFRGYLLTAMQVARHMTDQGIQGNIVHITSTRATRAYPGDSVYGGVKAGMERACESMALDLAPHGIRVNCVAPGATRVREGQAFYDYLDNRIPLGRVGTVVDVANAVTWVVSEEASYITGTTVRVDGGLILPGMPEWRNEGTEDKGWGFVDKK